MSYLLPNGQSVHYNDFVADLAKPGDDILKTLTGDKAHAWHMASCIPGEAGELFAPIVDHTLNGQRLDRENVLEELGDIEFYMEGLRQVTGIDYAETCVLGSPSGITHTMMYTLPADAAHVFDAVKKWVIYNKPLDRAALVVALINLEMTLDTIRSFFGIKITDVLQHNVAKLGVRYSGGKYSDAAAQERADKVLN